MSTSGQLRVDHRTVMFNMTPLLAVPLSNTRNCEPELLRDGCSRSLEISQKEIENSAIRLSLLVRKNG